MTKIKVSKKEFQDIEKSARDLCNLECKEMISIILKEKISKEKYYSTLDKYEIE